MQLIDADNLKAELFDANWLTDNDEHMVEKIVERQSTVDAEPVRHGRWEMVIVSTANPYESEIEEKCSLWGVLYNDTGHNHRTISARTVAQRWTEGQND